MGRRSSFLPLLAVAILGAGSAHAEQQELVVGTDTSFMPFEFKQGDQYVGFDLDLWAEIAKDQGWKYRIQPMDFSGLIPGLQTQNIDVALSGMTIEEHRKKAIDFSDPYYDSGLAVMVQTTNTSIKSIGDLNGKVIAAKTGTATINWLKANLHPAQIRQFPNVDQAYLALLAGRVDAAMHDTPNVLYFVNTAGKGKVRMAGDPVMGDKYGIGFPKGSALVPKVNEELKRLEADGRYATLYKKWFGTEPPESYQSLTCMRRPCAVVSSKRPREQPVEFDWSVIWTSMPELLQGVKLTIFIATVGLAGGCIVGVIAGMFRAYGPVALNVLSQVYIELIRGTPIVVQVMFVYFALPLLAHVRIDGLAAAVIAITVNSGAYLAEVIRGALLSIPKGLMEAGLAMGLSMPRVLQKIVGPLAFRRLIPPLGNQCIVSLKDTSLFIVIGVGELTRKGQEIIAGNFRAVEVWTAVALIYLVLTGVMTLTLREVERRMRIL